jgi:hypothetical protein
MKTIYPFERVDNLRLGLSMSEVAAWSDQPARIREITDPVARTIYEYPEKSLTCYFDDSSGEWRLFLIVVSRSSDVVMLLNTDVFRSDIQAFIVKHGFSTRRNNHFECLCVTVIELGMDFMVNHDGNLEAIHVHDRGSWERRNRRQE